MMGEPKDKALTAVKNLTDPCVFAVLAVLTKEEEVVLMPIGGKWNSGITDTIREAAEKYPGCKMQLFERCSDWKMYFEGIVQRDQVLPYADYSTETKAALEEIRQKVLGCR
ncbi:MAG TPA: hypothetical protein PK728_01740 [Bacillota bacterium]|nr:hypothetical protein [Bacillota bacterium]